VKNCDRGLENAARGIFKTSVTFFTIRASQPANNIYIYVCEQSLFSSIIRAKERKTRIGESFAPSE